MIAQSGLCCAFVAACLASFIIPLMADKLDVNVKELIKEGNAGSLQQRIDGDPKFKVNAVGDQQLTALHWAAIKDRAATGALLLERRADIEQESSQGMTALHYAARDGHVGVADMLLDHNATVDALDVNSWTPLHWSALYGHRAVIGVLLVTGKADPLLESEAQFHKTAKALATINGHKDLAKVLGEAETQAKKRKDEEVARAQRAKNGTGAEKEVENAAKPEGGA